MSAVAAIVAVTASDARAHFLFVHIGPPAEAGRAAEVYFSEIATAGDPTFIDKIAHAKLWLQKTPGEFQPLVVRQAADRLRAVVPMHGSVAVIGECQYGVIARPNQTPFLLRYFPKAIAGRPDDLNRMRPRSESSFEIIASIDGDRITFSALRDGKPLSGALFTTVDADLENDEISAGADGKASWTPRSPGRYSVYTRFVAKQAGEVDGKRYDEIREFATLAFTWPLERRGPDAEAVALFEEALAARASWKNFPGFTAEIAGEFDGRPFDGTVTVAADGSIKLTTQETVVAPWVTEQLESIAMHRGAGSSAADSAGRAKPVLRFADDRADHPLGRLLAFEGGSFASSYRVRDKQIMVVNRHVGSSNMTITVLDNDRNADGQFLPRSYTVQYWDAATGDLRRTETVQDRWLRAGTFDLPASHMVSTANESVLTVRRFVLTKHALLKP
jgi:hypothetical protein